MRRVTFPPTVCSSSEEDFGFLESELASTGQRLSSLHPTSELAIPTQAYANAFADMRPSQPTFSFGPNDGSPMKLAIPSFALKQTSSGIPSCLEVTQAAADLRNTRCCKRTLSNRKRPLAKRAPPSSAVSLVQCGTS
eukprot:3477713-Rhodomonas_salina.1